MAGILHVSSGAGEELAAISPEEIEDVRALKLYLRDLHGFPFCLQQLLHNNSILDDSSKPEGPAEIQLVLLQVKSKSERHSMACAELLEICTAQTDLPKTARLLLKAGVDVNLCDKRGGTPLMHAAAKGRDGAVGSWRW